MDIRPFVHVHSILRWIVLLTALYAIIKGLSGMNGKKSFTPGDRKAGLFYMISCDIQLLLGLVLYFISPYALKNIQNMGMAAAMKDKLSRFWGVEHITGMLVAIILVHIMYSGLKKNISDASKFKRMFWLSLISLVLILATIPWPFREAIGRALFPGM